MSRVLTHKPTFIDPNALYTMRGFQMAAGISSTRISGARKFGVEIPTLVVGKRKFVRGVDGIRYIERLAVLGRAEGDA